MEESEQVPLLTKAKYLTNPSSASSSSSCETREETEDLCLPISRNEEEEEAEEENSPVREVALTVPTTDDPSLPVLTFRMWVLGTLSCILLSFLNQFFWYRREPLTISAISAQIAVVPLGRLMAAKITDRVFLQGLKWEFTLNPGPFNVKEHVLITIFANAGAGSVYAIHIITAVKAYYMKNMTFFVSFIVIVTTQVLGFGWAGIFRKYLVEPAAMWWPANLVQVSLFRIFSLYESQSMATKANGKSPVSSASAENVMFFRDITLGPHETQLRFRLIHFWEAWNPVKRTLIGLEMLLIDKQGTVIQGFITPGRIEKFLSKMKRGSVYKLDNFYGTSNKSSYRVSEHAVTVSFSWNSDLAVLLDSTTPFEEDRFRFHSYEAFEANRDQKGDLYDVVGHMRLVNGKSLIEPPVLDELEIGKARHVLVHVQSHDGPVMKLYLWDDAAREFCKKFKSYEITPTVLLVTTVNTKTIGGTLGLTSMSSSRVFMEGDVQPTIEYLGWLRSNPGVAEQVSAEVVTKREPLTIGELFSYMKQESAKEAFFECTATIDDVVHGSPWYYISCSGCHTKATKGPTSLMCTKCGKVNIAGVPQYRAKLSVYDNSAQAIFVLLGDAGCELTGKHASELVRSYFEVNGNKGDDHEVPVPEALISTIGQRHKFCVKVTEHNLSGKTRALTVTKILTLATPPVTESLEGNHNTAATEETFETGNDVREASQSRVDTSEGSKRSFDSAEIEGTKRPKCGK